MILIYILLSVLIVLICSLLYIVMQYINHGQKDHKLKIIEKQLDHLEKSNENMRATVDRKLDQVHRTGQNQFQETREVMNAITQRSDQLIKNVNEKLGSLDKTNQRIVDFSQQLNDLQNILKNPKQRGVFGEVILERILANVLSPENFQMQYKFEKQNIIVDAAVFVKNKVIPIDSKFSLENYNRMVTTTDDVERMQLEKSFVQDLKKRIQETAKYILPENNTTDFAFMFIPSEAIYYDLLTNNIGIDNLVQNAVSKYRVIIVSPTSFLAYLQTVLQGLKAMEIEERAQDIIKNVNKLAMDLEKYETFYQKIGKTLGTIVNHYDAGYRAFVRVDKDVCNITGTKIGIEKIDIDKPQKYE